MCHGDQQSMNHPWEILRPEWEKRNFKKEHCRLPFGNQWRRLHTPNAGDLGSVAGQGTRPCVLQLKIPHAATRTWHRQINTYLFQYLKRREVKSRASEEEAKIKDLERKDRHPGITGAIWSPRETWTPSPRELLFTVAHFESPYKPFGKLGWTVPYLTDAHSQD